MRINSNSKLHLKENSKVYKHKKTSWLDIFFLRPKTFLFNNAEQYREQLIIQINFEQ